MICFLFHVGGFYVRKQIATFIVLFNMDYVMKETDTTTPRNRGHRMEEDGTRNHPAGHPMHDRNTEDDRRTKTERNPHDHNPEGHNQYTKKNAEHTGKTR